MNKKSKNIKNEEVTEILENENKIEENEVNINKEENVTPEITPELMAQINFINEKFEDKMKEYEDKITHLKKENLANLANQKKQYDKDLENVKKYMFQKFFEEILIIGDSLEVGIKAKSENYDKFIDGLKMTFGIYLNTLKKYKVELIDVKIGDEFNDQLEECMGTNPEVENNKIASILNTGYFYEDRVLRPTKVVVGIKSES